MPLPPIRMNMLPDVPAIDELLPGYEGTWRGIVGPAGTPPTEVVAVINKVVNAALGDSKFKARGAQFGASPPLPRPLLSPECSPNRYDTRRANLHRVARSSPTRTWNRSNGAAASGSLVHAIAAGDAALPTP